MLDTTTLPVGEPDTIRPGMVWMQPIEGIFEKHSIDFAKPKHFWDDLSGPGYWKDGQGNVQRRAGSTWKEILDSKREDDHYEDVCRSLKEFGWVRPVTVQITKDDYGWMYGDGHHRLAAAIDAGMTHVPVQAVAWAGEPVSDDSGSWSFGCYVDDSNHCEDEEDY